MSSLIAQYFLNHRLDAAEIDRQRQPFASRGYHGVYAHARAGMLTPFFLSGIDTILSSDARNCSTFGCFRVITPG